MHHLEVHRKTTLKLRDAPPPPEEIPGNGMGDVGHRNCFVALDYSNAVGIGEA